jgi:hypothetical protein
MNSTTYTVYRSERGMDNHLATFTNKRKALRYARDTATFIDNVTVVYRYDPILPAWVEGTSRPTRIGIFWPA